MEILNIGPLELIIFLIVAFLLLGPKGMVLTAYKIGQAIRKFVRSPMWREVLTYSQEIRELPKKIMDETGLDAELKAVQQTTDEALQEVNTSLKEAAQAAKVPEAEHIKLETTTTEKKIAPPSMAAMPDNYLPAESEPAPQLPELSPADFPDLEELPAAEADAAALNGEENAVSGAPVADTPAAREEAARKKAALVASLSEPPLTPDTSAPEDAAPAEPVEGAVAAAETPAPRKRASRKRAEVEPVVGAVEQVEPTAEEPAKPKRRGRKPAVSVTEDAVVEAPLSVEPAAEEPVEPKRRGRKRADRAKLEEGILKAVEEFIEDPVGGQVEPKRRGRKRAMPAPESAAVEPPVSPEADGEPPVEPKRRGRKRAVPAPEPVVVDPPVDGDASAAQQAAPDVDEPVKPKRRGRKPAASIPVNPEAAPPDQIESSGEAPVEPKRRGRKRAVPAPEPVVVEPPESAVTPQPELASADHLLTPALPAPDAEEAAPGNGRHPHDEPAAEPKVRRPRQKRKPAPQAAADSPSEAEGETQQGQG